MKRMALLLFLLPAMPPANAQNVVHISPSQAYQTVAGWGTSLAWWANVVGGFSAPARKQIVGLIFDPRKGLGLNIVRYNIGGGENPAYLAPNRQFLSLRTAVPGYEPSPGVWNWKADANQRLILKMAMAKGANIVQAFSNSPPWWMTLSGSVTGAKNRGNNLKPEYYTAFAGYLARVVKHFHDHWGVTFESVEPLNEPNTFYWGFGGSQEGCHVDPDLQNVLIKDMGAALKQQGADYTPVAASDETNVVSAVATFSYYDPTALGYLGQIDTHTYWGGGRAKLYALAKAAGKPLWMSETGEGDASGMSLSERLLRDMNVMHAVAWVYWQAVDGGGWGLLSSREDSYTDTRFTINKKYYVLANYTRFIRPGFQIIGSNDANSLAACDAKKHTLVIVTTNTSDTPEKVTLDLSGFARTPAKGRLICTTPDKDLQEMPGVPIVQKTLTYTAAAKSVNTVVVSGVSLS